MRRIIIILLYFFSNNVFAVNPPTLIIPVDMAIGVYTNRDLQCSVVNNITDITKYTFQIDTVSTFTSSLLVEGQATSYLDSSDRIGFENVDLLYNKVYYWRVKVAEGGVYSNWSVTWHFTTFVHPVLYFPAIDAVDIVTDTRIYVMKETLHSSRYDYTFQLDTVATFDSPIMSEHIGFGEDSHDHLYTKFMDLQYNQQYYWRVRVVNTNDTSEWSDTGRFTTYVRPILRSPSDGADNIKTYASLFTVNSEVYGRAYYNYSFQKDTVPTFDSPVMETFSGSGYNQYNHYNYRFEYNLFYNQTYYWRVRVHNNNDTSEWSDTWTFRTYERPSLAFPIDGDIDVVTDTDLQVNTEGLHSMSDDYEYQIDTISTFDSPLLVERFGSSYQNSIVSLENNSFLTNQLYYWRVRVHNANDISEWSDIWHFTTNNVSKIDKNMLLNISIFPNPFTDKLNINMREEMLVNISIIDVTGRTIQYFDNVNISTSNYEIDMSVLPAQMYFVRITSHNKYFQKKIIKL